MSYRKKMIDEVREDWEQAWDDIKNSEHLPRIPGQPYSQARIAAAQLGVIILTPRGDPILGQNLRFRLLSSVLGENKTIRFSKELGRTRTKKKGEKAAKGDEPGEPALSSAKPGEQTNRLHVPHHFTRLKQRQGEFKQIYPGLTLGDPVKLKAQCVVLENMLGEIAARDEGRRSVFEFMWAPFTGRTAPQNFVNWLIGEPSTAEQPAADPPANVPERPRYRGDAYMAMLLADPGFEYHGLENKFRKAQVRAIEKWLEPSSGGKLVRCVYAPGTARGMSALARHLWETNAAKPVQDPRPWCYLPIARDETTNADPAFRATVARLWAFYKKENPAEASPDVKADGLGRIDMIAAVGQETTEGRLASIRRAMSEQAAVIILDGYQDVGKAEESSLMRLIRDDAVVALLERLVQPHVDVVTGESVAEAFRQTRILVLGASKLSGMRYLEQHVEHADDQFPSLDTAGVDLVLKQKYNADEKHDHVVELIKSALRTTTNRQPSDTTLMLLRTLAATEPDPLTKSSAWVPFRQAWLHSLISEILCRIQKASPDEYLALAIVALSMTGIRLDTLQRIFDRLLWPKQDGSFEPREINAEPIISSLRLKLSGLLTRGRDEAFPAIHAEPRSTEFFPIRQRQPGEDYIFEIADEGLRQAIIACLLRPVGDTFGRTQRLPIPDLHMALAEEALQQHCVLLRHSISRAAVSIRYYRRFLEGIWHGIMSAAQPISSDLKMITSLPKEIPARIITLYRLFRQNVEHAPDWWMTRMFGADMAKNELLNKFLELELVKSSPDGSPLFYLQRDALENYFRAPHAVKSRRWNDLPELVKGSYRQATFSKLLVDRFVRKENGHDVARDICREQLEALTGDLPALADREAALDISTLSFADMEGLAEANARDIKEALDRRSDFKESTRRGAANISGVVHLIERYAVSYADQADPIPHTDQRGPLFKEAYVRFRQAQRLVDGEQSIDPVKFSGSSTREFVRTCLRLAALPDMDADSKFELEAKARVALNRLSLRMCRYPSERAAILILESSFARLCSARDINAAARLLREAERILPSVANRPRLRFRFLTERFEVAKELADAALGTQSVGFARIKEHDLQEALMLREMQDDDLGPSFLGRLPSAAD